MTGTFFDTIIVCSATGLAIASSGMLGAVDDKGKLLEGVALTNKVFEMALGTPGRLVIPWELLCLPLQRLLDGNIMGKRRWNIFVHQAWACR